MAQKLFTPTAETMTDGTPLRTGYVDVLGEVDPDQYDRHIVGPMYRVRQADGSVVDAFEDELED